jgi:hypothetical protein
MPKFIIAVAVWLVKRSAPRTGDEADAGCLGRHGSRPLRAAPKAHEPHVDLGPLDLTRRH